MADTLRALRRRILTPSASAASLSVRGFHEKSPAARELLEGIGQIFLTGYAYAVESRSVNEAEARLEQIPPRFRGFSYEGAAMGYAMLDGLPLPGRHHVADFLHGRARNHSYMTYVGVGWAMARLPRFRWSTLTADDTLLRWLVLDGYGFHQAYFHTAKYVHGQARESLFPWPKDDSCQYAGHAIDQGIGRAIWFVGGADPGVVADLLDTFPESRRADLYSGAGLAATYAGGADERELRLFWDRAGQYRPQVAQAAVFAATTRVEAGLVLDSTHLATRLFCAMTPDQATRLSEKLRPSPVMDVELPAYEVWRRRIAAHFVSEGVSA